MSKLAIDGGEKTFNGSFPMWPSFNEKVYDKVVDILKSGTRREELILPELWLEKVRLIRRGLANHKPTEAMERLLFFLKKCHSNAQLMQDLKSQR